MGRGKRTQTNNKGIMGDTKMTGDDYAWLGTIFCMYGGVAW